ncbi:hypothetical protein VIBNISOn1_190004 [Vibrio nigripulchritudo SOn1]|uniref:Uncharacterized protein n=1 Tax=Vibrio nigripulchritudo SOn1 TaxID=1238450 RepID=A0AAV2VPY1_9VIBR|nr:hypothetical protein [Vibrio nigripulchritudo]CCO46785.1 hypothetical protein VIBNISOn1_190004 [Vibrio nigripulchritudo SOn1]
MSKTNFATRDSVNFFGHLGKPYPTPSVCKSESRCMMSLFKHANRSYVVLKTGDPRQLAQLNEARVSLYRKDSVLAIRLSFNNEDNNPFFSILPFSATLDSVVTPSYPEDGQMEIEVHFIDYLQSDVLRKVIRIQVNDDTFRKTLVTEYDAQLRAEIPKDLIKLDAKALLSTPYRFLDKYLLVDSSATIVKQDPDEDEPLFNENIASPYNALAAV